VCDEAPAASDASDSVPDCDAALVGDDGALRMLGRGGVIAAQRLGRSLLLLRRDLVLVVRDDTGRETTLATAVADPRVSDDGARVAFAELPPGTTELAPGTPTRLVLLDLAAGTRRVIADHPMDSSPFVVPGSEGDVVFVSARTGVAAVWISEPGAAPRQITNRGARAVGPGFTPVFGRELTWIPGTRRAVYTASYGGAHDLWSLDLDTGVAARLGPGRFPSAIGDVVTAIDGDRIVRHEARP
jgi:Tol biopolymer transport system component